MNLVSSNISRPFFKPLVQKIARSSLIYLQSLLELQLVISLLSLPILICWGIPTSIMAPLAHLIFTPILIVFLWCSCLTTMCILLSIPSSYFQYLLHKLTDTWFYLLSFAKSSWIIGFPTAMLPVSIAICAVIFVTYSYFKPSQRRSFQLLLFLWCSLLLIRPFFTKTTHVQQIGTLPLWAIQINGKLYLIDHGALCTRKNLYNNLNYTVLPELIKATGHYTFDTIVFCKPSNKMAKVAQQCCNQCNCSTLIVTTKGQCYQNMLDYVSCSKLQILPMQRPQKPLK